MSVFLNDVTVFLGCTHLSPLLGKPVVKGVQFSHIVTHVTEILRNKEDGTSLSMHIQTLVQTLGTSQMLECVDR